jgi:hypothetical protein
MVVFCSLGRGGGVFTQERVIKEGGRQSETFANGVEIPMKNSARAVAEVLVVGSAVRKFCAR